MPERPPGQVARPYAPTALPSVAARVLAVVAIAVGGLCGAVIGYAVTDLQCGPDDRPGAEAEAEEPQGDDGGCGVAAGLGAVGGAVVGGGGVAVVAVLVLRAMAEWRRDLEPAEDGAGN